MHPLFFELPPFTTFYGALGLFFFSGHFFCLTGLEQPNYPMIWQGLGMVIGVFGLGYWWAASDPVRHWPIVAVGFLGKILGPIGYFQNVVAGTDPVEFGYMLFTNDLIWWIPFAIILRNVYQRHQQWKNAT
jgi:hypothetical protein